MTIFHQSSIISVYATNPFMRWVLHISNPCPQHVTVSQPALSQCRLAGLLSRRSIKMHDGNTPSAAWSHATSKSRLHHCVGAETCIYRSDYNAKLNAHAQCYNSSAYLVSLRIATFRTKNLQRQMLRRAALTKKIYFHIHGMNHSVGFILPFIHTLYKVSHLTWNTSLQHAAAAANYRKMI
jgi:hypothetical protein